MQKYARKIKFLTLFLGFGIRICRILHEKLNFNFLFINKMIYLIKKFMLYLNLLSKIKLKNAKMYSISVVHVDLQRER